MGHPDPYPQILPALLNSGDIRAYAEHNDVQFIQPFVVGQLKSASYHIPCEGTVYTWEISSPLSSAKKIEVELKAGATFTIQPNSIVYVCPVVVFKLPNYLAIRFNLTIAKVHQGLLLGTGPLVDPGFEGRLLIPLHNLTNQEVVLHADDMLMWVEVTKLSPDQTKLSNPAHQFPLVPFPDEKKNKTAAQYFRHANQGKPILSSVQSSLDESKVLSTTLKRWLSWGALGGVAGIAALILSSYQIIQTAHNKFDTLTAVTAQQKEELDRQHEELAALRKEVRALTEALEITARKLVQPKK